MTATPLIHRRRLLAAPALALLLSAGGLVAVHGQEATPAGRNRGGPHPAHIHAGSCGEGELGDVVAPLTDLAGQRGGNEGNRNAIPGAGSFTTVSLTLDQILAADHAINVHLSAEEIATSIACGEIGGTRGAEGSLVIGLREIDGSGHSGIAFLSPGADGASTDVSVFVAETAGDRQRDRDRIRGQAGADETPAAVGGTTGTTAETPAPGADAGAETPVAETPATGAETPATGGMDATATPAATEDAGMSTETPGSDMATSTPEGGTGTGMATATAPSGETPSPVVDATQPPVIDGTSSPTVDATASPAIVDVGATATAEAGG